MHAIRKHIPRRNREGGFSLIELSILMVIMGLMVASALDTYRTYLNKKIAGDNADRSLATNLAVARFFATHQRLPCPARADVTPEDPNAGIENCLTADAAVGYCEGTVCRVVGARDTAADPDTTPDNVLVGAVPFRSLGISISDSVDAWNNKMTYAVTQYLTNSATFNDLHGAINVLTRDFVANADVARANPAVLDGADMPTPHTFMYVVLSHGPDGRGAYSLFGRAMAACTGGGRDLENCNGDSVFLDPSYRATRRGSAEYYDDAFVITDFSRQSGKWQYAGTANSMRYRHISGRVGIGTDVPRAALDVMGSLRADRVKSTGFCRTLTECFGTDIIASPTGSACHHRTGGMRGFKSALPECGPTLPGVSGVTCPGGMKISASGGLECR